MSNQLKEPDSSALLSLALRALCLTRDYVGEATLPAIPGWDWYDAGKAIAAAIPQDEWAEQFRRRARTGSGCVCRLCGKSAQEIECWLTRVNETGVPGVWECRPKCGAQLPAAERVVAAINGDNYTH